MVLKRVFVTGGTGTIGRQVVRILKAKGYQVKLLSRNKHENTKNIKYIKGDINEAGTYKKEIDKCQGVIHLAAQLEPGGSEDDFYKVNYLGTKTLIDNIDRKKQKVVCVSTISIYDDCGSEIRDENWKKMEKSENPYIKTKLMAYKLCHEMEKKLPIVVVMPTVVIDDRQQKIPKGLSGWLWKLYGGIPGGLMCSIGNSKRYINYVLVDDLAKGIVAAMETGKIGEDYILGGENISVEKYLLKMKKYFNKKTFKLRIPFYIIKIMALVPKVLPKIIYDMAREGFKSMKFSSKKSQEQFGYTFRTLNG
jgi:nucleoside-diphosphate-sugar epimerase